MKKIVLSCLIFLLLTFSFVPYVQAEEGGSWYNQDFKGWYTKVYDKSNQSEIFGERYTAAQVEWIIWSVLTWLPTKIIGPDALICAFSGEISSCVDALFASKGTGTVESVADNKETNLASAIFATERPLSAITYFKNVARKFHLIPEAKAQNPGFGFGALDPILPIWTVSRNLAYALFVIVILIMAFMIMFRVKISPQVVITVQSALPKLVIALILVTFSYAIAGFLVDLMYVVIGLISLFVSQVFSGLDAPAVSPGTIFGFLTQGFLGTGIMGVLALYLILFFFILLFVLFGANGLGGVTIALIPTFGVVLLLLTVLLTTVLAILLIFIGLKILWMLLKTFVRIFLLVIVAPFQIALGVVLPGVGFNAWLRSFVSNLAVFPLTGLLIALSYIFLGMAITATIQGLQWTTFSDFFKGIGFALPGINAVLGAAQHQGWPPLLVFGVKNTWGILFLGVSVVILFILPKAADIIKAMIEGKPFAYGTAIGEAFGPARLTAVPIGEATYEMGKGKIFGRPVPSGVQDVAAMVSRIGEFLGVFPKHK